MLDFLHRIIGKGHSKDQAKERLRLVLVHDRADLSPHLLEALREELIDVFSKYMEIDETGLEMSFESQDNSVALIANIPIRKMKRGKQ